MDVSFIIKVINVAPEYAMWSFSYLDPEGSGIYIGGGFVALTQAIQVTSIPDDSPCRAHFGAAPLGTPPMIYRQLPAIIFENGATYVYDYVTGMLVKEVPPAASKFPTAAVVLGSLIVVGLVVLAGRRRR